MERQQDRRRWSSEEEAILSYFKNENPRLTCPENAELLTLAGLDRNGKSCRERWHNTLNPNINRGNFSLLEDAIIMESYLLHGSRWAFIASHLPGRTNNAIKNRFKNHLKKKLTRQNIHLSHYIPGASPTCTAFISASGEIPNPCFTIELESLIAGFGNCVAPNVVNPNEHWNLGPLSGSVDNFMETEEVISLV